MLTSTCLFAQALFASNSALSPRDIVALSLLVTLFVIIAALGQWTFAVKRASKRWLLVRIRSNRRSDHDPRWR